MGKKILTPGQKRFIKDLKSAVKKSGLNQGEYGRTVLGLKSGPHFSMILSGKRLTSKIILEYAPKAGLLPIKYIDIYNPDQDDRCITDQALDKWPFFEHLIRAITPKMLN